MKPRLARVLSAAFAALALSASSALAHHSTAMYNRAALKTLSGTVAEVRWANPHVTFLVTIDDGGQPAVWTIETTSPGNLTRYGWTRQSVTPRDRVEVLIAPLRDGSRGGLLQRVKFLDTGKVLEAVGALYAGEKPNLK